MLEHIKRGVSKIPLIQTLRRSLFQAYWLRRDRQNLMRTWQYCCFSWTVCCTDKCVSFVKFHWDLHFWLLYDSFSKKVKSPKMWAEKMAFIGCIWPAASCVLRMKYSDPEVVASCFSKVLQHPGMLFFMESRGSYSQIGGRVIGVWGPCSRILWGSLNFRNSLSAGAACLDISTCSKVLWSQCKWSTMNRLHESSRQSYSESRRDVKTHVVHHI